MMTLVTGLWNIGRGNLDEGWSRSYDYYLDMFSELLKIDHNLIIFGDQHLKDFVFRHRSEVNTQFILRDINWFKNNEYFNLVQTIRTNSQWYNQVGWLSNSTQSKLEFYNPLVMSKMFLLNDAKLLDKFNSDKLFWIDAGLANTVSMGYFTHDKVLDKINNLTDKFLYVCFPYDAETEVHGFNYKKMCELTNNTPKLVARGGFFGGDKETIEKLNITYYNLLISTLNQGYMGTEESLFTILLYQYPSLIDYCEIESNGLVYKFFEDVKNNSVKIKNFESPPETIQNFGGGVGLYVISFNSPKQFETLIKSMLDYDPDFITKTKKFLLDNSTDLSTTPRYKELCHQYEFEHIKKDNLGICGGRQFVAEHFSKTELQYMWFSEDDMSLYKNSDEVCKNGFNRYTPNLYSKCVNIIKKEKFDFLKICYTEFYGHNGIQFSWYNLSQDKRQEYFPDKPNLPIQGLDPNPPKTKFNNINSYQGLPYIDGEIYYCNWTHIISQEGNKKMFLDTKWNRVFENTWMSHHYQLTKQGKLRGGLLLLSPIDHNRFDHYPAELRKES